MTTNKETQMPSIPTGFLDSVSNMLSFEDDILSDDNGRLSLDDLEALREEMKKQLDTISYNIYTDLNLVYDFNLENKNFSNSICKIFKDFGLNLINKLSTRFQNAHVKISYTTVVGYVFEEISKSTVDELSIKILDFIDSNYNNFKEDYNKESAKTKITYIIEMQLKNLQDKFKLIDLPSEIVETKTPSIKMDININDPKFVENIIKKVDSLLDNNGKKAMLKYVEKLANQILKLK